MAERGSCIINVLAKLLKNYAFKHNNILNEFFLDVLGFVYLLSIAANLIN